MGIEPRESEHSQATVMFADVSGFTAMSSRMDPEDLTDLMNRCFGLLEEAVTTRGGWIDKYIGDCLLAVFDGGDGANARRAVEAALDIRDRIRVFTDSEGLPSPLEIHVGLESGDVLVHRRGDGAATVIGETVATADWLKDAAPLRAIFLGPAAYDATRDVYPARAVHPTNAKGGLRLPAVYEIDAPDGSSAATDNRSAAGTGEHASSARDGDRRQTTVVFAEVTGLTSLASDDVALGELLAAIESTIRDHGGHLDKYVGDCVMALFGAPLAIEDAPRQALNAAIALRRLVAEFSASHPAAPPLDVHVGVNSGLVLAGEVGGAVRHDFTVMGDTVNLASRIKDATPSGAIYVGPSTWAETIGDFTFEALPPMQFKGIGRPVEVRGLSSDRTQQHRERPVVGERRLLARMVGRDREVGALRDRLADLGTGRGGIVSIVAEAGMGKSRLLAEMARLDEARAATLLEGRSLSMGSSLSFHPFSDALRQWLGIADEVSEGEAQRRLATAMAEALGETASEAYPFIATLMGLRLVGADAERLAAMEGEALERLLGRSLRELLAAMAAVRPVVLAFEDLHWADRSSIKLLQALLPLVRKHPVLFVLVCRPDHAETSGRVLTEVRARWQEIHLELPLGRLDDRDCARLLRQLVQIDERPATTRRVVLGRAEGNPFFIEETVRSLIDLGAIERTPEGLRITERIETVEVPSTIQGVVMSRVDRLPELPRRLLQAAAVVGRTFPTRLLRAMAEDADRVDGDLVYLEERQLIEPGRAGDEPGWAFTHALAQETVYESILRRKRRELHGDVARTVERLFGDRLRDYYGMLAYHYGHARNAEKAGEYLMKAGDEAVRVAASHEAVHYFSEAARVYVEVHGAGGDPLPRANIEKKIGLAYLNKGDLQSALDHFDAALTHLSVPHVRTTVQIARRLTSDLGAIVYHVYRPVSRRRRPPTPRVVEMADICFHKGKAQSTSAPQGYVLSMLPAIRVIGAWDPSGVPNACGIYACGATLFAWSGLSFSLARRMLGHAEGFVRSVPDRVVFHSMRFLADYLEGDWRDERVPDAGLFDQGLRYGMFWEVNTYLGFDCERAIHQGRFAAASTALRRIAEIGDGYGYDFARTNEYAMRAFMLLEARRLPEALDAVDRYHGICTDDSLNILALGTRARILLHLGDIAGAAEALEEGEEIAGRLGRQVAPYHLTPLLVARASFDLAALEADGRPSAALARRAGASARRALALGARNAGERTEARRLMGRLHWLRGRRRRALRCWESALAEGRRLGVRPEVARLLREVGQRLTRDAAPSATLAGMDGPTLEADADRMQHELERDWATQLDGDATARPTA